ncbi:ATP-binding protein, partial [Ruegeria sp. NA]
MATAEDHFIEYKDFHREQKPSKKAVLANLFREISAFANTSGGEIIVGLDDKTHVEYVQPDCVYDWLENDRL